MGRHVDQGWKTRGRGCSGGCAPLCAAAGASRRGWKRTSDGGGRIVRFGLRVCHNLLSLLLRRRLLLLRRGRLLLVLRLLLLVRSLDGRLLVSGGLLNLRLLNSLRSLLRLRLTSRLVGSKSLLRRFFWRILGLLLGRGSLLSDILSRSGGVRRLARLVRNCLRLETHRMFEAC